MQTVIIHPADEVIKHQLNEALPIIVRCATHETFIWVDTYEHAQDKQQNSASWCPHCAQLAGNQSIHNKQQAS